MNEIVKRPLSSIGYNFVSADSLSDGKNEYHLRNLQNRSGTSYRKLTAAEIEMLVIGILIIAISYLLIKYLRTPKHGFSFEKDGYNKNGLRNVEALIIAQSFGKKEVESKSFEFGGGSSGGGGATGNY